MLKIETLKIAIYTDSDYVKRGLTEWVDNWIKNDWKRKDGGEVPV